MVSIWKDVEEIGVWEKSVSILIQKLRSKNGGNIDPDDPVWVLETPIHLEYRIECNLFETNQMISYRDPVFWIIFLTI